MMIRFCLHPDFVQSVNDGDMHKISAPKLAQLYGVRMSECVVDDARPGSLNGVDVDALLHLYPSSQGAAYREISDAERRQYPLR